MIMKKLLMKTLTFLTALCMLCACDTSKPDEGGDDTPPTGSADAPVYVYLIGGQSNAVGNGYLDDLERKDLKDYPNVYYYSDGEHANEACRGNLLNVTASYGQGRYTYSFGMEYGMAKIFTQEYEKDNVKRAIIKYAYDGSDIKSQSSNTDWNVYDDAGTGSHYKNLIQTVKDGLKKLEDEGYTPVIKGFAWMQGESNHTLSDYQVRLEAIRDKARVDLKTPNMQFVMGEIAFENYGESNYVNNAIHAIAQLEPTLCKYVACGNLSTRCKKSACLTTQSSKGGPYDYLHWSGKNMLKIGEMFAQAFLELDANN